MPASRKAGRYVRTANACWRNCWRRLAGSRRQARTQGRRRAWWGGSVSMCQEWAASSRQPPRRLGQPGHLPAPPAIPRLPASGCAWQACKAYGSWVQPSSAKPAKHLTEPHYQPDAKLAGAAVLRA
jgi:hypothetical protein